jgi:8-oxo-dGTP diphosphatase
VLLIERAAETTARQWALPGGLLLEGESLDEAAKRKLEDETGVSDVFLEQLYTFDRLGEGRADIVVTYFALVDLARTRCTRFCPESSR